MTGKSDDIRTGVVVEVLQMPTIGDCIACRVIIDLMSQRIKRPPVRRSNRAAESWSTAETAKSALQRGFGFVPVADQVAIQQLSLDAACRSITRSALRSSETWELLSRRKGRRR